MQSHHHQPAEPTAAQSSNYLRRRQVAQKLGLSIRSIERLALDGGGPPFVVVGRIPLYPEDSLEAWLRARMVRSTSAATVARAKVAA
jgi:predicted DNA-binding transcriptional regulator AlpA